MPVSGNRLLCSLALGALLGAQAVGHSALAAEGPDGYEGWAFSTTEAALARDPLADYRQYKPVRPGVNAARMNPTTGLQLSHTLDNGMALDAGMTRGREPVTEDSLSLSGRDYQDAFLGFRYHGFSGRVWYLDQPGDQDGARSFYYQAGWKAPVNDRLSVSLQMGQSYRHGIGFDQEYPDLSIAAESSFDGYGLGIRLIDRSGLGLAGEDPGYSLMGSFSKRFP
jgi:hypothetical protein